MRSTGIMAGITVAAAVGLSLYAVARVHADDERDEVAIRVRAPLDAPVDCTTDPTHQTITMFSGGVVGGGLVIDITSTGDCQALADALAAAQGAGQPLVTVQLADEGTPLVATRVRFDGEDGDGDDGDDGDDDGHDGHGDGLARHDDGDGEGSGDTQVEIQAPARNIDSAAGSFTLLGLLIDASGARVEGAGDDDEDEGEKHPIDLSQLEEGQFVEAKLVDATPPLVAEEVEIKNFDNGTDCTVVDEDGHDVNDDEDDITVAVTSRPKGAASRKVRFSLHSNGHFVLRGLPTGSTKVVATRTRAGSTTVGRKRLKIKPNVTRSVRVMLRPAH